MRYTKEIKSYIIEQYRDKNKTAKDLAKELNMPYASVRSILNAKGIKKPDSKYGANSKMPIQDRLKIIELYKRNWAYIDIVEYFDGKYTIKNMHNVIKNERVMGRISIRRNKRVTLKIAQKNFKAVGKDGEVAQDFNIQKNEEYEFKFDYFNQGFYGYTILKEGKKHRYAIMCIDELKESIKIL